MDPGKRLARARRLNGFRTRKDFYQYLNKRQKYIPYARLGRLERNEDSPSGPELNLLCDELTMSADYYLRNNALSPEITSRRIDEMPEWKRELLLKFADALFTVEPK